MAKAVSDKDVYLDADGQLTDDADKAALQVAFKGAVVSDRAKNRYSLADDGSWSKKESAKADDKKADAPAEDDKASKTLRTDSVRRAGSPAKKS
jgi:hypothetical protein